MYEQMVSVITKCFLILILLLYVIHWYPDFRRPDTEVYSKTGHLNKDSECPDFIA